MQISNKPPTYFMYVKLVFSVVLHHVRAANDCYDVTIPPPPLCYSAERRCSDLSDGRGLCVLPRPRWSRTSTHVPALDPACKNPCCPHCYTLSCCDVIEGISKWSPPPLRKQAGGPAQRRLLARRCEKHTGGCLTGCVLDLYMVFMGCFIMPGCIAGLLAGKSTLRNVPNEEIMLGRR